MALFPVLLPLSYSAPALFSAAKLRHAGGHTEKGRWQMAETHHLAAAPKTVHWGLFGADIAPVMEV
ncbi:MAG: hypothetical protein VYA68_00145, partial [Pseudomonadota bacterium]|nr:hypothetical protein [Pseudomonadota bacterium]